MNRIIIALCLSFWLGGQEVRTINPKEYESGPDYRITRPNFVYRGEFLQFRGFDYKNFVLHTFDKKNGHVVCGQLHEGKWEDREENHAGLESLTWEQAYPLSSGNPSIQYVLAFFTYFGVGGSSESGGYVQVWRLQDKQLTIVQQIQFNTHFAGEREYFAFDKDRQSLTVRASHYMPGDAHCCISAFDELTFRWEDGLFELQKKVTKPTHPASSH
jgi:hypothetical protein